MDPALGLSFFKSQNFRQRGDSGSNFFLKSFILTSRFQWGVCQAPIVCRFGVMELQSFAKFGLIRHIVSGGQLFARWRLSETMSGKIRHIVSGGQLFARWRLSETMSGKIRHLVSGGEISRFWHLENFFRFRNVRGRDFFWSVKNPVTRYMFR